uniref:CRAL-TRIO domain-containing protein n=1 Tax=Cryptomonas curvata TaxID=233186 RepID=A0A7S0MDF4_9CRYP|mmetsp:Transcript_32638/g.68224  ORF Transcript_32638/g.68224 Transcript_32638/m.68224 type:complete len:415 (+) Transcript_32638:48-1292(+)
MAFNPNRSQEYRIDVLLDRLWETGMTGQQGIDKMKDLLRNKGKFPVSEEFAPPEWIDTILLRFFIGFKRSATAAAEAFAEMMDWRAKNNINAIRTQILGGLTPEQFPRYEQIRRYYPLLKTGEDKNGCPIMITLTGLVDPAKLLKAATLDEIRLYIIYEMEHKLVKLCEMTTRTGVLIRALEIHDLKGLGMHHLATGPISMLRKVVQEVSANYVELADKVLLINCPFASVVRTVLNQVIPARSLHKLAVLGGPADYAGRLAEHADQDQYHPVLFGGPLPEGLEDTGEDDMETWASAAVPARDKKVVQQAVDRGTVCWSVCPEALDVAVDIRFVSPGAKDRPVFDSASTPDKRISGLQRGSFGCETSGTLVMTFDNTFSYLKAKVVRYHIEVLDNPDMAGAEGPVDPSADAVDEP